MESVAEDDPSDGPTMLDDPAQRAMFEAPWDWGFELKGVKQPFDLFYGDADEIVSPKVPKRVAEELPNGAGHVRPGVGHYGFVDRERWTELLGAVA
jgi:pimeloyl-ACP methyl ester carboxylesterase